MQLVEVRVSEIQPGDLWLLEGGWVVVNAIEVGHPDDRVGIDYINDGTETALINP